MNRLLHTRHAIPWMAVGAAAVPGTVLLVVGLGFQDRDWAHALAINGLLLLAVPAAFILDDPAAPVAAATPRSPWWDLGGRLLALWLLCGLIAATAWAWHALAPGPQPWLLALNPICLAIVAVAGSSVLHRTGRTSPGDAIAGGLAIAVLGLSLFRPTVRDWELMPRPGSAGLMEVWLWIGAAAMAVLVLTWAPSGRSGRAAVDA